MGSRIARVAVMALVLACPFAASAAPRVPADDAEVLERLPSTPGDARAAALKPWREALARNPADLGVALKLARAYVEVGRTTGDPRYAGYAEAALAPWWRQDAPPAEVRVLRAVLRQRLHQFDAALQDLDAVIAANPRDAQARLTRATVLQVQARFAEAQRECAALQALTRPAYAESCAAGVASLNGDLAGAISRLEAVLRQADPADAGTQAWILGMLAEMAERAGRHREAESHYREALRQDAEDQYLLAAYADFLLDRNRPAEVVGLLRDRLRADGLLLRYALAVRQLRQRDAEAVAAQLGARFEASRRRGDRVHLREEARYVLEITGDPRQALALAADNWAVQKEPADALILLRAAIAAGDTDTRLRVQRWVADTRLQDVRVSALLADRIASAQRER